MVTPEMGNRLPDTGYFGIDNGCFAHPERFDIDRYSRFVLDLIDREGDRCLFATAPDVPFDADGTIARFDEYHARMTTLGAPVAIVTQDGMQPEDILWPDVDAMFVGGSTEWKTGYESSVLIAEARRRGMWVHMARVNSWRRFKAALSLGCDSVDGTFLKYGPDVNWPRLQRWLDSQILQPSMVLP